MLIDSIPLMYDELLEYLQKNYKLKNSTFIISQNVKI